MHAHEHLLEVGQSDCLVIDFKDVRVLQVEVAFKCDEVARTVLRRTSTLIPVVEAEFDETPADVAVAVALEDLLRI